MATRSAVAHAHGRNPQEAVEVLNHAIRDELEKIAAPGSKVTNIDHNVLYMPQNTGYHDVGPFFASAVITYEIAAPAPFQDIQAPKKHDIPPFPFGSQESADRFNQAASGRPPFPDHQ